MDSGDGRADERLNGAGAVASRDTVRRESHSFDRLTGDVAGYRTDDSFNFGKLRQGVRARR